MSCENRFYIFRRLSGKYDFFGRPKHILFPFSVLFVKIIYSNVFSLG